MHFSVESKSNWYQSFFKSPNPEWAVGGREIIIAGTRKKIAMGAGKSKYLGYKAMQFSFPFNIYCCRKIYCVGNNMARTYAFDLC